ncbi:MAG: hypothetical protein HZA90_01785 [Verrucomicrobia bacterium]|nr:hypothetical protein [Verrucomicrobiota bacterium]
MQRKQYVLASLLTVATCAFLALSAVPQAQAADASGTWSWSRPGRGGGDPVKTTLKLKVDGEKLTGTVSAPGRQGGEARETAISDGKVKGDDISFSVVREFNGNKMTQKYTGKVSADAIKGKVEFDRNGETQSRDWEAKREK